MLGPMANTPSRVIRVVAAVISKEGRYLITQRRPSAVLPGLWEFPGGKVEAGEPDETALAREVFERLGVQVQVDERMAHRTHEYDGYTVDLNLYATRLVEGQEPRSLRVADHRWVTSEEFEQYRFPAADQATMDLLLGIKRG
jgi:8-oxo-dGTP diphosphatase